MHLSRFYKAIGTRSATHYCHWYLFLCTLTAQRAFRSVWLGVGMYRTCIYHLKNPITHCPQTFHKSISAYSFSPDPSLPSPFSSVCTHACPFGKGLGPDYVSPRCWLFAHDCNFLFFWSSVLLLHTSIHDPFCLVWVIQASRSELPHGHVYIYTCCIFYQIVREWNSVVYQN